MPPAVTATAGSTSEFRDHPGDHVGMAMSTKLIYLDHNDDGVCGGLSQDEGRALKRRNARGPSHRPAARYSWTVRWDQTDLDPVESEACPADRPPIATDFNPDYATRTMITSVRFARVQQQSTAARPLFGDA